MNRERGEVTFEASGKTWTLKIGTNAMCAIEAATGKGIAEVGRLLGSESTASMGLVRTVFWGALMGRHPEVTEAVAGDLIDEIGIADAGALIGQVFELAFPAAKAGEARPRKAATAA